VANQSKNAGYFDLKKNREGLLIHHEHRITHVGNLSIAKAFLTCENT